MKSFMRVSEAANLIGVSASTLRRYEKEGRITSLKTPTGQRVFTREMLVEAGFLESDENDDKVAFYTRSSDGDAVKIQTQVDTLTQIYGDPDYVYSDKASGLNEKRRGLKRLLRDAKKGKYNILCVTHEDRLSRFGYSYLELLLNEYGVSVKVVGNMKAKTIHDELIQDFLALLASFSGRYYRLRGHEQKKDFLRKIGDEVEETHQ